MYSTMKTIFSLLALSVLGTNLSSGQSINSSTTDPIALLSLRTSQGQGSDPATQIESQESQRTKKAKRDYQNVAFGIYAGANSTKFRGEDLNGDRLTGRLGYQAGFFIRAGGRLYGQIGAEYFASSSNFFRKGDGQSVRDIRDQINLRYVQIPVYIGVKLLQSDRGISAVRLQAGLEYANRVGANSNSFNLSNSEIKSGAFNGLGQLGFDIGPLLIDLTYHHGFDNTIKPVNAAGFAGSQRRILSASVGFKF